MMHKNCQWADFPWTLQWIPEEQETKTNREHWWGANQRLSEG